MSRIFVATEFIVNSLHHQSVRDPGKGMRIVAKNPDGIVEAIESTDPNRFIVGVQWHPEKLMAEHKIQSNVFRAFVEEALKGKE